MIKSGDKLAYSRILGNLKRFPNSFPENDNRGLDGFFQNSRKLIKGFRKRFPNTFRVYYVFVFGSVGNPKRVSYSNNLGNPLRVSDSTEFFYGEGLSQRQAARVSQKCVFDVSKKLKQDLPLANSVGQGRGKATTPHVDCQLLRIMKKDRTKSSQMLSAEWALSNGEKVSACTVRRRLISMGYKSYTAKRKPLRTPAQIKQRLPFAKDHQHWLNE